MAAGIFAGIFLRNRDKWKSFNTKLTMIAIYALLFVLGVSIGTNKEIIQNLPKLGWIGLLISLASVMGSIVAAGFFYKKFIKPSQKA